MPIPRSHMKRRLTLLACVAAGALGGAASLASTDLNPRDYVEIEQLYAKSNVAFDTGDAEGYAATYTQDGVFNKFSGHDAIVDFVKNWRDKIHADSRKHWITNLELSGDSKQASGFVYIMLIDFTSKPMSIAGTATSTDSLVKTKQGWRFTRRTTKVDAAPAAATSVPSATPSPAPAN